MEEEGFEPGAGFKEIAPHCYVHESSVIEEGVTFEGRVLVGADARVGAHTRLSGVVCLGERTVVAPGARLGNVIAWNDQSVPTGHHDWAVFWADGLLQVR